MAMYNCSFTKQCVQCIRESIKIIIIFVTIATSNSNGYSQPNAHWHFGYGAGLDFSNSQVQVNIASSMFSSAGSASISDQSGNLLFYTNGVRVWDNSNNIMLNGLGLLGDSTSRNAAMIVPMPGNDSIYYIFTYGNSKIHYTVVDMSMNGGLGEVTSTKNISLTNNADNLLLSVYSSTCEVAWIITRQASSNTFNAFNLSSSGLSASPIQTSIGTVNGGSNKSGRSSHDGNKIAVPTVTNSPSMGYGVVEIFDFNKSTGKLSNVISISDIRGPQSVEFSPNNKVLYAVSPGFLDDHLYQWDISSNQSSTIIQSQFLVDSTNNDNHSDIQLGSDGRIYVSIQGTSINATINDSLSIINNPNVIGSGCGFLRNSLSLKGRQCGSSFPRIGFCKYYIGIEEGSHLRKEEIVLYPNPASDVIFIASTSNNGYYRLADMRGRIVKMGEYKNKSIPVYSIRDGNYILEVSVDGQTKMGRITIRK